MNNGFQLTTEGGQAARPSKALVFRCDGEDTDCNPAEAHWLTVSAEGFVTSWASWGRAMLRATKGY